MAELNIKLTVEETEDPARDNALRFKIIAGGSPVAVRSKPLADRLKALKPVEEYSAKVLSILGVPYGGHLSGRDSYGEAFHGDTDIWMNEGDSVPLTYYHGFGPDDPWDWQDPPVVIGRAVFTHRDERGFWFDGHMDESEELALRVINALDEGEDVKASSGAVGHLVREGEAGLLNIWPVGEMAVFDTNDVRQPANQFAEVGYKSTGEVEPKADEVKGVDNPAEDLIPSRVSGRTKSLLKEPKNMEDEKLENQENQSDASAPQVDVAEIVGELKGIVAEVATQAAQEAVKGIMEDEGLPGVPLTQKAPAFNRNTSRGFSDEPVKAYYHWVRTGDRAAVRAALQEDDETEGGVFVPEDVLNGIVEKRDEASIIRKAIAASGGTTYTTSRDVFLFPMEDNEQTEFVITEEEDAADEDEMTFTGHKAEIHRYTKLVKVSKTLLEDIDTNLDAFLNRSFGRKIALTENKYTIGGNGSNQPQGILFGGLHRDTFASATAIAATEIIGSYYDMPSEYRDGAVWIMNNDTEGVIRGLTGNPFLFGPTPSASGMAIDGLMNKEVFNTAYMPQIATGAKSLIWANLVNYGFVERKGLSVQRLTELYAVTGQIGLLAEFRFGGVVLQNESVFYYKQA